MNYKPYGYVQVGDKVVHHVPADDVKLLSYDFNLANTVKSLQQNGITYTVPTGRKFVMMAWTINHINTATTPIIGYSSGVDGIPTALKTLRTSASHASEVISLVRDVPASQYISMDPAGIRILWSQLIGYEVDV